MKGRANWGVRAVSLLALAGLLTLSASPDVYAYYNRGTVQLALGSGAESVNVGSSTTISATLSPQSYSGVIGCGQAICPQQCNGKCGDEVSGACACAGPDRKTESARANVSVADPFIASASYSNGTITIKGKSAGSTTVNVTGTLWQYTSSSPQTISVTVVDPNAGSEGQQPDQGIDPTPVPVTPTAAPGSGVTAPSSTRTPVPSSAATAAPGNTAATDSGSGAYYPGTGGTATANPSSITYPGAGTATATTSPSNDTTYPGSGLYPGAASNATVISPSPSSGRNSGTLNPLPTPYIPTASTSAGVPTSKATVSAGQQPGSLVPYKPTYVDNKPLASPDQTRFGTSIVASPKSASGYVGTVNTGTVSGKPYESIAKPYVAVIAPYVPLVAAQGADISVSEQQEIISKMQALAPVAPQPLTGLSPQNGLTEAEPLAAEVSGSGGDNGQVETKSMKTMSGAMKMITLTDPGQVIGRTIMEEARENKERITFQRLDDSSNVVYSWTFEGEEIETPEDISFDITFPDTAPTLKKASGSLIRPFYISFTHDGVLPGPAEIYVNTGSRFSEADNLTLYLMDTEKGRLVPAATNLTVQAGYVSFTISHNSDYVLAVGSPSYSSGSTTILVAVVVLLLIIAGGATLVLRGAKRRRTLNETT